MGGVTDSAETINAWGNFLLIPLSVFPAILNLKYYYQLKIKDYLYVSFYFIFWSFFVGFWLFFNGFQLDPVIQIEPIRSNFPSSFQDFYLKFFYIMSNTIDALPLAIVAVRGKYGNEIKNIPKWLLTLGSVPIILALFGVFDQSSTMIRANNPWTGSILWGLMSGRIIYHSIIIYAFVSMDYSKTKRTTRSRTLWITGSFLWIVFMVFAGINSIIFNYQFETDPVKDIIFFFLIIIGSVLILLNHVYYPESVIITFEQIHMASNLYKKIELKGNIVTDLGISKVKQYLDSLPVEYLNN